MNANSRTLMTPRNMFLAGCLIVALLVAGIGIRAAMAAGDTTVSFAQAIFVTRAESGMRKVDVAFTIANPRADTGITAVVDIGSGATMQVDIPAGATTATKTMDMPSVGQLALSIKSAAYTCAPTCSFGGTDSGSPPTVVIGTPNAATTSDTAPCVPDPYPGPGSKPCTGASKEVFLPLVTR